MKEQPGHIDSLVFDVPVLQTKEGVDRALLAFLLAEKEEEEKMERFNNRVAEFIPVSAAAMAAWRRWILDDRPSSSGAKRRKKRKRRKKKLPRGLPLRWGRAHRL